MAALALVHLVRKSNGLPPFQRFLESYRAHDAGTAHELLIAYKGFGARDVAEYEALLRDVPHRPCFVPDAGFDIGAYFRAVREFPHPWFAFANSFSRIRCAGWLGKLFAHAQHPGVGAAGASGSWQSLNEIVGRRQKRRSPLRQWFFELKQPFIREHYAPFPNPHLRTNAFCASRELLLQLRVPPIRDKAGAHRFESGLHGFTAQIRTLGRRVIVVGCDGRAYEEAAWPDSNTFRRGEQANLLVADNQTEGYAAADARQRAWLSAVTWDGSPTVVELAPS